MKHLILFIIIPILVVGCNGQSTKSIDQINSDTIRYQAEKMGDYLVRRISDSFIDCHYPKAIALFGSREKAIKAVSESWVKNDSTLKLLKITVKQPSKILYNNGSFQCTVPQIFEYKIPNGRAVIGSILVGISYNGEKWYFIDVAIENVKKIKAIIPDINPELIIPEPEAPKRIED